MDTVLELFTMVYIFEGKLYFIGIRSDYHWQIVIRSVVYNIKYFFFLVQVMMRCEDEGGYQHAVHTTATPTPTPRRGTKTRDYETIMVG